MSEPFFMLYILFLKKTPIADDLFEFQVLIDTEPLFKVRQKWFYTKIHFIKLLGSGSEHSGSGPFFALQKNTLTDS